MPRFNIKEQVLFETESTDKPSRGSVAHYKLRPKYIYKRAHSELQLLNCLNDEKLQDGYSYNFITSGDVDALSFLALTLRTYEKLDHLLLSTWCMASEDIVQLFEYHKQGKIKRIDFYLGEIFKSSYPKENALLINLMNEYKIGRIAYFKNHSKIFAGITSNEKGFSIQSSANINTNPRTENACINMDTDSYYFYKEYFDNINSF
jgi:hypothetical protein